jgi:hypothetical protein
MKNGVYRVLFRGPVAEGRGILVGKDGALWGGDSGFVYNGSYGEEGPNNGKANLQIRRDDQNMVSVFGDLQDFRLDFTFAITPSGFTASGAISGHPNLRISAEATRLAEI